MTELETNLTQLVVSHQIRVNNLIENNLNTSNSHIKYNQIPDNYDKNNFMQRIQNTTLPHLFQKINAFELSCHDQNIPNSPKEIKKNSCQDIIHSHASTASRQDSDFIFNFLKKPEEINFDIIDCSETNFNASNWPWRQAVNNIKSEHQTILKKAKTRTLSSNLSSFSGTGCLIFDDENKKGNFVDVPMYVSRPKEDMIFSNLVSCDTVDKLGRPVVTVNTKAILKPSWNTKALMHIKNAIEPIVSKGPYVMIFLSFSSSSISSIPTNWVMSAYRNLDRPFRKNIAHLIMVKPNRSLKFLLSIFGYLASDKGLKKLKQIKDLSELEMVTNGEVSQKNLSSQYRTYSIDEEI